MRAMTWWDHETDSIWSQPWGRAIRGPLEGTRLDQIPAAITPWDVWLAEQPDSLVLAIEESSFRPVNSPLASDFVIGIALSGFAKGYPFTDASQEGAVNDQVGSFAVVVVANAETKAVHAFLRNAGGRELEFSLEGDSLVDLQTGSTWSLARGIAVDGPLRGEVLQRLPYTTAFQWAWRHFYPHTEFYQDGKLPSRSRAGVPPR